MTSKDKRTNTTNKMGKRRTIKHLLTFNATPDHKKVNVRITYFIGQHSGSVTIMTLDYAFADLKKKRVISIPDADERNRHIAEMFELLREPAERGDEAEIKRIADECFIYRERRKGKSKPRQATQATDETDKTDDTNNEYIRPLADNITPEGHAIAQRIREKIASCCK